jgi:hypothetical protein
MQNLHHAAAIQKAEIAPNVGDIRHWVQLAPLNASIDPVNVHGPKNSMKT